MPKSASVEQIRDPIIAGLALGRAEAESFSLALANLYNIWERADEPVEEFVDSVALAAEDSGNEAFDSASAEEWAQFRSALCRILSLHETFGVLSKVLDVLYEQERLFHGSRVITDLRPIFRSDPEHQPEFALMFHTLRIEYYDRSEGSHRVFQVALDAQDITQLRKMLDRACVKERSLRDLARSSGFHLLEAGPVEGRE